MHIQSTKKVLDFLKPEITIKNTDDDLYAWHANYIVVLRRKLLVLMNDLTRFTVVFYGVKKSDLKNINVWLVTGIYNAMQAAGISRKDIMKYFQYVPERVTFSKTKNKTMVARMNMAVEQADLGCQNEDFGVDINSFDQPQLSKYCNNLLVCQDKYKVCYVPKEKLQEYIDLLY